jgi:TatA/E family protein of Tat protein translocase
MFYLFILESIGTSELLLIGLVALIIFGPRKLPELARMLGKARNEFKRTTDDFKETWVREVDFESEERQIAPLGATTPKNIIQENESIAKNEIIVPEIRETSQSDFENNHSETKTEIPERAENSITDKRDWL